MKLLPLLLASLALLAASPIARADLLTDAQRAYTTGDVETAKKKFTQVLAEDPGNLVAKNYLKMIQTQEARSGGGKSDLQKQLEGLVISKVAFKDATFGTALEYLRQIADRESGGKIKVNFVVNLPGEFTNSQKVTMDLANVPFTEILHYMGTMADVKFSVEKYAVVVQKKDTGTTTTME